MILPCVSACVFACGAISQDSDIQTRMQTLCSSRACGTIMKCIYLQEAPNKLKLEFVLEPRSRDTYFPAFILHFKFCSSQCTIMQLKVARVSSNKFSQYYFTIYGVLLLTEAKYFCDSFFLSFFVFLFFSASCLCVFKKYIYI